MSANSEDGTVNGAEIIVVLGGGIVFSAESGAQPSPTTKLRASTAAALALKDFPASTVIVSGRGRHTQCADTEAEVMARTLEKSGVERSRILLEDESFDTIGNAVFVAARYLHQHEPRPVIIVTSPFHVERALACFRGALGPQWPISAVTCPGQSHELKRSSDERAGVEWTQKFFRVTTAGNIAAVCRRLISIGKPQYKTNPLLRATAIGRKLAKRMA